MTTKPSIPNRLQLVVDIRQISTLLFGIVGLLIVLSAVSSFLYGVGVRPSGNRVFNVDLENNVPTYFSSIQLFLAAMLCLVLALTRHSSSGKSFLSWGALSAGFLVISADEICGLHERLNEPVRALFRYDVFGLIYFAWVVPALILVLILAILFFSFFRALQKSTRRRFIIAGCLYVLGAVGVEMLAGKHVELHGGRNLTYVLYTLLEEGLEMSSVSYFIRSILLHLSQENCALQLDVGPLDPKSV